MLRFLTIFMLFTLTLKAQVNTIRLKIIFQKDVNPTKLIMIFDDGLNEKVVKFSELDAEKGVTINTECHAEYLKIAVIGLYKEDKFGNYEVFYAQNASATIEFSKNTNLDDNQIYLTKLINVEERKNIGESKYNGFIAEEVTKSLEIRKQYSLNPSDSLKQIADSLWLITQTKTFRFISENATLFYAKDLFYKQIDIFHQTKSKSELLSFYEKTFDKPFQLSLDGKRIYDKLINLALDYGTIAPNIITKDLNGKPFQLKNYLGQYVLINFWATWCKPCIQEMPVLQKIKNELKPKEFELISISSDENESAWLKFIKKNNYSWTHILGTEEVGNMWRVNAIPKVFLLDKIGRIIYSTDIDEDSNLEKLKLLIHKLELPKK